MITAKGNYITIFVWDQETRNYNLYLLLHMVIRRILIICNTIILETTFFIRFLFENIPFVYKHIKTQKGSIQHTTVQKITKTTLTENNVN